MLVLVTSSLLVAVRYRCASDEMATRSHRATALQKGLTIMYPTITTGALLHTASNNYRCADSACHCQDGHEPAQIGPTSFWPLRPGSDACAWCADEQGIPLAQRTGSHGICARHAEQLIAAAKARKQRKGVQA